MHTCISISNVCLFIVLVETNPISQKVLLQACPGAHCVQIGFRKALTDTVKYEDRSENTISRILTPNVIGSSCQTSKENYLTNNILKLVYNKVLSNPVTIDKINDFKLDYNDGILHYGPIPSYTPNVVNNFIIVPKDTLYNDRRITKEDNYPECTFTNPNFCIRVKKNAHENIFNKSKNDARTQFSVKDIVLADKKKSRNVQENSDALHAINLYTDVLEEATDDNDNQKQHLKKPFKRNFGNKHKSMQNKILEKKNTLLKDFSVNENRIQEIFKTQNSAEWKKEEGEKKKSRKKNQNSANTFERSNEEGDKHKLDDNSKKVNTSKKTNKISKKYNDNSYDQPKKTRTDGIMRKNQLKEENPEYYKRKEINLRNKKKNRDEKTYDYKKFPFASTFQLPDMQYDNDMYKYMNDILSNYQIPNSQFIKSSPFNYNNIYQFSKPPWSNINTRKIKSKLHRRRKQRHDYKKRSKKKLNTRKKQTEKKLIESIIIENENTETTTPATLLKTSITTPFDSEEKIRENLYSPENSFFKEITTSTEKSDPTMNLDNLPSHNNTFNDESLNYNLHPSFIIGMEDNVPIIFENGLIDDYYPNFTADNELLYNKETLPSNYPGDKYHYVSNQYVDFEDYVKTRKRLAMKNMNKTSIFCFSENDVNRDVEPNSVVSKEDKEVKSIKQIKSPRLLDNPDFRTRKIDSNEKYEPYYHHNTLQDPDEDLNKYYADDKSLVYSTSTSFKHNVKNKLFNDIDVDTKSKWKKVKDSNVETVHARSKLAKYGFSL